jgi:hypothetical protein
MLMQKIKNPYESDESNHPSIVEEMGPKKTIINTKKRMANGSKEGDASFRI